jgi:hypothetical protein
LHPFEHLPYVSSAITMTSSSMIDPADDSFDFAIPSSFSKDDLSVLAPFFSNHEFFSED